MVFRNIFLFAGLTLLFSVAFAGEKTHAQVPHKFKVHVNVNCDDEDTESLIQSYIKRELRSLGDVHIVGFDDAQYILTIVVVEGTYKATGRKSGDIAMGSTFLTRAGRSTGLFYYPYIVLDTGNTKDLDRICKERVADIDTSNLEPIRELFQ